VSIDSELADITGQIQGLVNERFALLKSYQSGQISKERYAGQVERIERQADALDDHRKSIVATKKAVAKYGGSADMPAAGVGFGAPIAERKSDSGKHWAELVNNAPYFASPTMADAGQRQQLEMAIASKMPCRIEVKAAERSRPGGFHYGVQTKAAIEEGSFSPALPGLEMPNKYLSFPYEPTRLSSYVPGAAMDRFSAFWISETAHANEASTPGEGGTKPDLGPTLVNNEVVSTKIAGLFSYTYEVELDVPGGVSGWILYSLQRSIINQENNLLLNAASGTDNATFNGWLNTSGTLTQNGSGLNGLDAIIQAAAAMRSSTSSFASPDLLITSPNTVAAILQEKDNQGRYLNDVIYSAGPGGFTWNGGPNESISPEMQKFGATPQGAEGGNLHLAGIPVVQTTQIDDYTAVMLSLRNGGGVFWVRQNMFVLYDPYTLASTNEYRYVAEERVALSVPRPAAVNLISDLAGTS
jgi:Phage capsid family